ncbi:MAG: hypothetical protein JWQ73_1584 [Variovorax sp.]|nr:hypothetical protein [Variovorax sp.]
MLPGDVLSTGSGAFAMLRFEDGSRALVPSDSQVQLLLAQRRHMRLKLLAGRVESRVTPQAQRTYEVETRRGVLGVRGTHFVVRDDGDRVSVEVIQGAVAALTDARAARPAIVRGGFGATMPADAAAQTRALLPAPAFQERDGALVSRDTRRLSAQRVPDAAAYQLQIASDDGFEHLLWELQAVDPAFTLPRLPAGFYHLRMAALDHDGLEGLPGQTLAFVPHDGSLMGRVERIADGRRALTWEPQQADRRYVVELARDPQFNSIVTRRTGVNGKGLVLPELPPGRYWWRVSEEQGAVVAGSIDWTTSEFDIAAPAGLSPRPTASPSKR